jgi:hypothetical protein
MGLLSRAAPHGRVQRSHRIKHVPACSCRLEHNDWKGSESKCARLGLLDERTGIAE